MKLVNERNGRVLAEGNWNSVGEAVTETNEGLDEETYSVKYGDLWFMYTDLAFEKAVPYHDYKTKYAKCRTKKGSYDASSKTIIIYVKDF